MRFLDVQRERLCIANTTFPALLSKQCLIKVKAIGVNRADILQRQGKYPAPKGESPILGLEVSGILTEVPNNNLGYKVGDRVCGLVAGGGYAEYVAINIEHIIKIPEHYSFEQGAGIAEVFLTAYQSLFSIAQLKPQQKVLIHAGASGVGSAAIQLAKALNCYVVTTVGSDEKAKACTVLGADITINYQKLDYVQWAKEHQCNFDVILDVVAGEYLNKNLKVAAFDARIVILSMLGGRFAEQVDIARMLQKRVQITASTLRNRSDEYKAMLVNGFSHDFMYLLENKSIMPVIDHCYTWLAAEDAHQKMMSNKNIGKLILTIDE
ncbi:NAD(P)H-quinone oxidoreductase [Thalassotalea sp. M1531]|uniref:NAD(P)H-quinone oxidoreductase n=2 Tax=Thalassotalea algicola TaxID=2716224 RepID=A0A7Y0LBX5_9GAMM|nr:NAD(P)H-quinone oxidoreductase [Thalassotalea algicola]